MKKRRIGILTGGGDVPGLNAVIKSVYMSAKDHGWLHGDDGNVLGILRGWKGTVHMGFDPETNAPLEVLSLNDEMVRPVDRTGGTILHTSRIRPDRIRLEDLPERLQKRKDELVRVAGADGIYDVTQEVIRNLEAFGIDCLVAVGGDDTLGYAQTLNARGFPVVGIPKTMDNDVRGTEYAIGYQTALARADTFINRQRTHNASHETVGVFRIFGRNAGFTALGTAEAITDLRCAIPEYLFDLDRLCEVVARDHHDNARRYALVIISEGAIWKGGELARIGAPDAYGHRKRENVGEALAAAITRITGLPTRPQDITYDLRSGDPDAFDKIVANTFGALAVELIHRNKTGRMVCLQEGVYSHAPLPDVAGGARKVDVPTCYDSEQFRPRFSSRLGKPVFLVS